VKAAAQERRPPANLTSNRAGCTNRSGLPNVPQLRQAFNASKFLAVSRTKVLAGKQDHRRGRSGDQYVILLSAFAMVCDLLPGR